MFSLDDTVRARNKPWLGRQVSFDLTGGVVAGLLAKAVRRCACALTACGMALATPHARVAFPLLRAGARAYHFGPMHCMHVNSHDPC